MSSVRELLQSMPPLFVEGTGKVAVPWHPVTGDATRTSAGTAPPRAGLESRKAAIMGSLSAAIEKLSASPPRPTAGVASNKPPLHDVLRAVDLAMAEHVATRIQSPDAKLPGITIPAAPTLPDLKIEARQETAEKDAEPRTRRAAPAQVTRTAAVPRPVSPPSAVQPKLKAAETPSASTVVADGPKVLDELAHQLDVHRERLIGLDVEIEKLDGSLSESKRHIAELTCALKARNAQRGRLLAFRRAHSRFMSSAVKAS